MLRVYISHPFGGNIINKDKIEDIIRGLSKKYGMGICFVSAVHLFGFLYDCGSYVDGINLCLNELDTCDEIWFYGDWEKSQGCLMEYAYASAKGIDMRFSDKDGQLNPNG